MSRKDRQWNNDQYSCEEHYCRNNKKDFFSCVVANCPSGRRRDLEDQRPNFDEFAKPDLEVDRNVVHVSSLCKNDCQDFRDTAYLFCKSKCKIGKGEVARPSTPPQAQDRFASLSAMSAIMVNYKRCLSQFCHGYSGSALLRCQSENCWPLGTQRTLRKRRNNDAFLQCVHSYCSSHPHKSRMVRCIYEKCHN